MQSVHLHTQKKDYFCESLITSLNISKFNIYLLFFGFFARGPPRRPASSPSPAPPESSSGGAPPMASNPSPPLRSLLVCRWRTGTRRRRATTTCIGSSKAGPKRPSPRGSLRAERSPWPHLYFSLAPAGPFWEVVSSSAVPSAPRTPGAPPSSPATSERKWRKKKNKKKKTTTRRNMRKRKRSMLPSRRRHPPISDLMNPISAPFPLSLHDSERQPKPMSEKSWQESDSSSAAGDSCPYSVQHHRSAAPPRPQEPQQRNRGSCCCASSFPP